MTDEWIKKMCYIQTMECYSAIKKNEIMSFVSHLFDDIVASYKGCYYSNMDATRDYHTK